MTQMITPQQKSLLSERIVVISDAVSATQQISFFQPFADDLKTGKISLSMEPQKRKVSKSIFHKENPSIFIMSRYTKNDGDLYSNTARKRNIPSIYHIDDDLLNVPISLGEEKYLLYSDPIYISSLRKNMESCDLIYVSTAALKEALHRSGICKPIVAGSLYCSVDPSRMNTPLPSRVPTLGYMGTGGHSRDLASVLPAVVALMEEMPDLYFETFGTISPPDLGRFADRYAHHAPVANYDAFLQKLCALGWWVGLAPLEDNAFNRCKADTKWVEYSYAGIASVVQDLPVYGRASQGKTALAAGSVEEWYKAMRLLLRDQVIRYRQVAAAQEKIKMTYGHEDLKSQVLDVFEEARRQVHVSPGAI